MKIITENAAYVQKQDVAYLVNVGVPVFESICRKLFGEDMVVAVDDNERYQFVAFDAPEEIEFFQDCDYVIDYNQVKDLSEEELFSLVWTYAKEQNQIAEEFNSMSQEEKQAHLDMVSKWDLLDLKVHSIIDILFLKKGYLKMELPQEVGSFDDSQQTGLKRTR